MKTVKIIGCGALGTYVAEQIIAGSAGEYELVSVFDKFNVEKGKELAEKCNCAFHDNFEAFLAQHADLIIELASAGAVKEYLPECVRVADIIVLSVGGLLDPEFLIRSKEIAKANGHKIYVAAGAIGGLDLVRTVSLCDDFSLTLKTTKPPKSLRGIDYLINKNINVDKIAAKTELYSGPALDAVTKFPKNINVSASLALAAGDLEKCKVKIVCDPEAQRNKHEIFLDGAFGKAHLAIEALPSKNNPKTSMTTGLSVIALLKNLSNPLQML